MKTRKAFPFLCLFLLSISHIRVNALESGEAIPEGAAGDIDWRYPNPIVDPLVPCPEEAVYPHPRNCTWFYRCHDTYGVGYFYRDYFQCEPGTEFDDKLDQCVFQGTNSTCDVTPVDSATCQEAYGDCAIKQLCPRTDLGTAFIQTVHVCASAVKFCPNSAEPIDLCGNGEDFDLTSERCIARTEIEKLECREPTERPPLSDIICEDHLKSCQTFQICSVQIGGEPLRLCQVNRNCFHVGTGQNNSLNLCQDGFLFNPETNRCQQRPANWELCVDSQGDFIIADDPTSCVAETESCDVFQSCESRENVLGCTSWFSCGLTRRIPVCQRGEVYSSKFGKCLAVLNVRQNDVNCNQLPAALRQGCTPPGGNFSPCVITGLPSTSIPDPPSNTGTTASPGINVNIPDLPNTGTQSTGSGTNSGTNTGINTVTNTGANTGTSPNTGTNTGTNPNTSTSTGTDPYTSTSTGTDPNTSTSTGTEPDDTRPVQIGTESATTPAPGLCRTETRECSVRTLCTANMDDVAFSFTVRICTYAVNVCEGATEFPPLCAPTQAYDETNKLCVNLDLLSQMACSLEVGENFSEPEMVAARCEGQIGVCDDVRVCRGNNEPEWHRHCTAFRICTSSNGTRERYPLCPEGHLLNGFTNECVPVFAKEEICRTPSDTFMVKNVKCQAKGKQCYNHQPCQTSQQPRNFNSFYQNYYLAREPQQPDQQKQLNFVYCTNIFECSHDPTKYCPLGSFIQYPSLECAPEPDIIAGFVPKTDFGEFCDIAAASLEDSNNNQETSGSEQNACTAVDQIPATIDKNDPALNCSTQIKCDAENNKLPEATYCSSFLSCKQVRRQIIAPLPTSGQSSTGQTLHPFLTSCDEGFSFNFDAKYCEPVQDCVEIKNQPVTQNVSIDVDCVDENILPEMPETGRKLYCYKVPMCSGGQFLGMDDFCTDYYECYRDAETNNLKPKLVTCPNVGDVLELLSKTCIPAPISSCGRDVQEMAHQMWDSISREEETQQIQQASMYPKVYNPYQGGFSYPTNSIQDPVRNVIVPQGYQSRPINLFNQRPAVSRFHQQPSSFYRADVFSSPSESYVKSGSHLQYLY